MLNSLRYVAATGLIAAIGTNLSPVGAWACSRILSNANSQASIVARTMDLNRPDDARVVVFPRGMDRVSDTGDGKPLVWKSRYGSVAVTARGASTTDGINEKGLVVNILYLGDTKYEPRDERPALPNLQWGQYVLDNFGSVQEAVEGIRSISIVPIALDGTQWPLHLAISDAEGDSAVIEFVASKMVVHHGKEFTVMTNEPPLSVQLENIKKYKMFGGTRPMPGDIDPESRFVRAASYLKTLPPADNLHQAIADAQALARNVAVPRGAKDTSGSSAEDAWPTLWFSVADSTNRTYFFQSASSPSAFWVDLRALHFTPDTPVLELDAYDTSLHGDITEKLKTSN